MLELIIISGFIIRNISPIDDKDAYADDIAWQTHESHPTQPEKEPVEKHDISIEDNNVSLEDTREMAIEAEIVP